MGPFVTPFLLFGHLIIMPLHPFRSGPRRSRRLLHCERQKKTIPNSKANIEFQFQNPNINPSSVDLSGTASAGEAAIDPVAPGEASNAMVRFGGVCGVRGGCLVASFTFFPRL